MRWHNKNTLLKDQVAKTRIIHKFIWFPKCLPDETGKEEWRWLEYAHIRQSVHQIDIGGISGHDYKYCWCDDNWWYPLLRV